MAQGLNIYPYTKKLWDNITIRDITEDDIEMNMDTSSKINTIKTIVDIVKVLKKNIKTLGVNTDNFYNFLKEKVDIKKVLESDIDFILNTINITTLQKLYLNKKTNGR